MSGTANLSSKVAVPFCLPKVLILVSEEKLIATHPAVSAGPWEAQPLPPCLHKPWADPPESPGPQERSPHQACPCQAATRPQHFPQECKQPSCRCQSHARPRELVRAPENTRMPGPVSGVPPSCHFTLASPLRGRRGARILPFAAGTLQQKRFSQWPGITQLVKGSRSGCGPGGTVGAVGPCRGLSPHGPERAPLMASAPPCEAHRELTPRGRGGRAVPPASSRG